MTPDELEQVYTLLCNRLTEAGEVRTPSILARLALLIMHEIDDPARIAELIREASAEE